MGGISGNYNELTCNIHSHEQVLGTPCYQLRYVSMIEFTSRQWSKKSTILEPPASGQYSVQSINQTLDLINTFNSGIFLCLSKTKTCSFLCLVRLVKMRADC